MTHSPLIDLASAMRRAPAQERSKAKVRAILDAADELLGEMGYEALVATPWPIVERAGVTVGAFYHYFEGGEAVLEALGLRYFQSAGELVDALAGRSYPDWESVVDAVVDTYADFYGRPSVRELWLNNRLTAVAKEAGREVNDYIYRTITDLLESASDGALRLTPMGARITNSIGDQLLRLVEDETEPARTEMIIEVKIAMRSYCRTFLGGPDRPRE